MFLFFENRLKKTLVVPVGFPVFNSSRGCPLVDGQNLLCCNIEVESLSAGVEFYIKTSFHSYNDVIDQLEKTEAIRVVDNDDLLAFER